MDFKKDSNLIIMNSKKSIENYMNNVPNPSERCVNTGAIGVYYTDLRPSYFKWEDNELKIIGSRNSALLEDKFWVEE
jgi:hypothetical protein